MTQIPSGQKILTVSSTVDTNEKKSTQANSPSQYYTIGDIAETLTGSANLPTTTVVNISSAQILSMGTTPIELLPAAGVDKYYDIDKVILEYTHVTTAYTLADLIAVYGVNTTYGLIYDGLISTAENMVYTFSPIGASDNTGAGYAEKLNKNVVLSTVTSTDPTLGDGTLRAIITYTTRTFGA